MRTSTVITIAIPPDRPCLCEPDLDRASPNNWLNDNFWLKKAYHEWRAPLPVNSNWWLLFHDDPNVPEDLRRSIPSDGQITEWQVRRAAWLVRRLVDFKEKLDRSAFISKAPSSKFASRIDHGPRILHVPQCRQEIHPDSSRTGPFCMYQYTRCVPSRSFTPLLLQILTYRSMV